jgi:hypothetical protein
MLPENSMKIDYWVLLLPGGLFLLGYIGKKILFVVFGYDRAEAIPKLEKEIKDYNPGLEVGNEIGEKVI